MERKKIGVIVGGVALAAALTATAGVAASGMGDDDDQPLTGDTHTKAVEAALAYTGGGTVTETEVGDDGAAYDVEVRLDDGSQVEIQLDADFKVIGQEQDDDSGEEDEAGDDD
ncbi:MAG TPA: PepSY domain-containing protein [Tepidiformaceae bacterium]|nr:PepSY domain-containing protein [Tepidiformaceae bacterium]